jgi:hypothetical protein
MALAGEDKTRGQLVGFERIIYVHLYLTLDQFGPAGTAYASFAGKGQIGALEQGSVQYGFAVISEGEIMIDPIEPDRDLTDLFFHVGGRGWFLLGRQDG